MSPHGGSERLGGDKTPCRMEELLLIHCGMAFSTCPSLFRLVVR